MSQQRDAFLSHRSTDKEFVRRLAADIETERHNGRALTVWLDEAEIPTGGSIPGHINRGLEQSRFILLVMTPAYFDSPSGWSDAEWHATLHADPDNRRHRLLPVVAADCPYIPFLLRHLLSADLREGKYRDGLCQILRVLKGEPAPRPVAHRGQLKLRAGSRTRAPLFRPTARLTMNLIQRADQKVRQLCLSVQLSTILLSSTVRTLASRSIVNWR